MIVGPSEAAFDIAGEVVTERTRQNELWGFQHHPDGTANSVEYRRKREHYQILCKKAAQAKKVTWADIFLEEVFEAMAEEDLDKLRTELIQCAAVATAWVEDIDWRVEQLNQGIDPCGEGHSVGSGLDKVQAAVRAARGGDAPTQVRGFA